MHPQYFLFMGLFGPAGLFLVYRGLLLLHGDNEVLIFGAFFLAVALGCFLMQWKKLLKVSPKVEKELDELFPPEVKRKVLILLEDSCAGYQEASVHSEILKASRGDMKRLKKIASALIHGRYGVDLRGYPIIENIEKKLDQNTK